LFLFLPTSSFLPLPSFLFYLSFFRSLLPCYLSYFLLPFFFSYFLPSYVPSYLLSILLFSFPLILLSFLSSGSAQETFCNLITYLNCCIKLSNPRQSVAVYLVWQGLRHLPGLKVPGNPIQTIPRHLQPSFSCSHCLNTWLSNVRFRCLRLLENAAQVKQVQYEFLSLVKLL
jgi:hypothetical protein